VKLVVPVRLYPGATSEVALRDTLTLCNQAAGLASAQAFRMRVTSRQSLQRMVYGDLKAMGLSAQPAIHVARKVCGAYAALRANIRAGNLGEPGSKRRAGGTGPGTCGPSSRPREPSPRNGSCSRSGKEARFAADVNHVIPKRIVTEAERTGRGIALEDLTGIRARVRLRKPQRVTLHSWAFAQLGHYIACKAAMAGVPVVYADPAYTSQMCSSCGHVSKKNRPDQATFRCTSCGFAEHADVNAARNIAARGAADWAVSHAAGRGTPMAAGHAA